jgi:hypothetical protein
MLAVVPKLYSLDLGDSVAAFTLAKGFAKVAAQTFPVSKATLFVRLSNRGIMGMSRLAFDCVHHQDCHFITLLTRHKVC